MADPFSNMVPGAFDPLQVLLVKAAYYAKTSAEARGATDADGMLVNMTPQANDHLQVLAYKLAYWLEQLAGAGGGSGAQQVYFGASPPAAPDNPALPALYYPTTGGAIQQWDGSAWL